MMYDEIVYACAINRIFNFRCLHARKLIELFPIPSLIFELSETELKTLFPKDPEIIAQIQSPKLLEDCAREIDWCRGHSVRTIFIGDREYPRRLRECSDAPILLFYRGNADLNAQRIISIVGTRRATSYGIGQCRDIVRFLSRLSPAPLIVSGLAFGIDIAAHTSALDCGLQTIGVIPSGIDAIYPASHRNHAARMVEQGGILTDFHKETSPLAINFLRRNRIIAGMSDAVILVESDIKGGGMITARTASSYSVEVFAVPGRNTDRFSSGCNALIEKNEAAALISPESMCISLGWMDEKRGKKGKIENFNQFLAEKNPLVRNILVALTANSELDHDSLLEMVEGEPSEILAALTELEIDGLVETDLYGRYKLIKTGIKR